MEIYLSNPNGLIDLYLSNIIVFLLMREMFNEDDVECYKTILSKIPCI